MDVSHLWSGLPFDFSLSAVKKSFSIHQGIFLYGSYFYRRICQRKTFKSFSCLSLGLLPLPLQSAQSHPSGLCSRLVYAGTVSGKNPQQMIPFYPNNTKSRAAENSCPEGFFTRPEFFDSSVFIYPLLYSCSSFGFIQKSCFFPIKYYSPSISCASSTLPLPISRVVRVLRLILAFSDASRIKSFTALALRICSISRVGLVVSPV